MSLALKRLTPSRPLVLAVWWLFVAAAALPAHAREQTPIQAASEYDYPPFALVTKDGRADGFAVELLRAAARAMGREVEFGVGPWHQLKQELAEGRLQVLPLVARTPEREAIYDFTVPYLTMHGAIVVRKGDTRIRTAADLRGRAVLVMRGDIAEEYVHRHGLTDRVVATDSLQQALRRLANGEQDAVVVQKLAGQNLINSLGLDNLEMVGPPLDNYQEFCFAVTEGDKELLADLNEGLALVAADGTLDALRRKWLGALQAPAPLPIASIAAGLGMMVVGPWVLSFAWQRSLRKRVKARTAELSAANALLAEEINERKRIEAELERHRDRLEVLVAERTAALESAKASTEASNERLKRLNDELEQFAYVAAHDLKAPLRGVSHLATVLSEELEGDASATVQGYLMSLIGRVQRMHNLIDGILTYARAAREELPTEPVDTAELVREVLPRMEKPAGLLVHISPRLPVIHARRLHFQQVICNLVDNAIKHHDDPARGNIWIDATADAASWRFFISDDGPGIEPQYRTRIFEMFQTLGQGDRDATGIGLALVAKVVLENGGAVEVEERPPRGARFVVTWPRVSGPSELHAARDSTCPAALPGT